MLFDYHMHSRHSHDAHYPVEAMIEGARRAGLTEICITDHIDIGGPGNYGAPVMADMVKEIRACMPQHNGITVKLGMEVGINTIESGKESWDYIKDWDLDFIIASVHEIGAIDPMYPEFYVGREKQDVYREYLQTLIDRLPTFDHFCVMGHYNFPAKFAPYADTTMKYTDFPDEFDTLFRYLLTHGKALELNTSAWVGDMPAWGIDIYKRFVELGGEYITIGSDAHQPERVGRRMKEAVAFAQQAGIQYIATFEKCRPIPHKIEFLASL